MSENEHKLEMAATSPAVPRFADEESQAARLARKSQEAPLFPIGLTGLTAACIYGAYKYKHRGTMSTSVYLMQLRVAAQGIVVACLAVGVGYTLAREFIFNKGDKKDI